MEGTNEHSHAMKAHEVLQRLERKLGTTFLVDFYEDFQETYAFQSAQRFSASIHDVYNELGKNAMFRQEVKELGALHLTRGGLKSAMDDSLQEYDFGLFFLDNQNPMNL